MAPPTVGKPFRPDDILCARDLAALGLSDEPIMAVTGHTSRAMVARYAGAARQKARAMMAQEARIRPQTNR